MKSLVLDSEKFLKQSLRPWSQSSHSTSVDISEILELGGYLYHTFRKNNFEHIEKYGLQKKFGGQEKNRSISSKENTIYLSTEIFKTFGDYAAQIHVNNLDSTKLFYDDNYSEYTRSYEYYNDIPRNQIFKIFKLK